MPQNGMAAGPRLAVPRRLLRADIQNVQRWQLVLGGSPPSSPRHRLPVDNRRDHPNNRRDPAPAVQSRSAKEWMNQDYPRDLIGYGRQPPHPQWPGNARIALQFVLNYEEGGENCVLHGDRASEQFLSEIVGAAAYESRHLSMESIYEYGSRAGVWRILGEFERRQLPLTVFGVAMALQRHPEVTQAFLELGHEVASHGWRWIHYQNMDVDTERQHL